MEEGFSGTSYVLALLIFSDLRMLDMFHFSIARDMSATPQRGHRYKTCGYTARLMFGSPREPKG